MAGLRLDSGDAALKGGSNGAVITPGRSSQSRLIQRVASSKKGFAMPPVGEPLTSEQIARITAWIDQGATVPQPAVTASSQGVMNQKSKHWAFQPVRRPVLANVRNRAWVRNAIDQFVLAKLEAEGIEPSPEAGRVTLLRRLSLDLTGLP